MKKFLKVFIIVLLVLAVIAGTCYFFFKKIEEKNNTSGSIAAMLQTESKIKFSEDLYTLNNIVNYDGSDSRMGLIIETSENLDEIVYVLATYYIETDTKINDKAIANKLDQVNSSRNLLISMIEEYQIKKDSTFFNRHTGANDFYKQSCVYLVQYASFANLLNDSLTSLNKTSDVKFSMFEIYSNIVINTFNETKQDVNNKFVVKESNNIDAINNVFEINDSYMVTNGNQFSINVNKFNEYYNKCDKTAFAKNLSINLRIVLSAVQDTNEKVATYYFKEIYGI